MEYVLINRETGEEIIDFSEFELDRIFGRGFKELKKLKIDYPYVKINSYKSKEIMELPSSEIKALLVMILHTQPSTNFIVNNGKPYLKRDLMRDMGTSDQMARRYFRELENKGFIKKERFDKVYWVIDPNLCCKSEFVYKKIVDLFGGTDETRSV